MTGSGEGKKRYAGRSRGRGGYRGNRRNLPCPNCREPNRLTPADVQHGYQCNECADKEEGCF